jgi:hypothetical protein
MHAQELRGMDRPAGKAVGEGHQPPRLVDEDLGLDEPDVATAGAQPSAERMFFTQWAFDPNVSANT